MDVYIISFSHTYTLLLSLLLQQRLVIPAEEFQIFHLAHGYHSREEPALLRLSCLWTVVASQWIKPDLSLFICILHLYSKEINRHSIIYLCSVRHLNMSGKSYFRISYFLCLSTWNLFWSHSSELHSSTFNAVLLTHLCLRKCDVCSRL